MTISELYIAGVKLPAPSVQGVTISKNKVWSANTGRLSNGQMAGTLLTSKMKLEIKWPPLTMAQYAIIERTTSTDWASVTYTNSSGVTETKTMYFGDLTGTQYSWADGLQYVKDVSISMIEK